MFFGKKYLHNTEQMGMLHTMATEAPKKNMARLVNASLANHSFQVLTDRGEGAKFYKTIKLKPLAATTEEFDLDDPRIHALLTRPFVGPGEVRDNPALRQRKFLVPYAPPGRTIETFTAMQQEYKTCKFQGMVADGTKQEQPQAIHLSVFQAQRLLLLMSDVPRIEFYLRVDERPLVQAFGRDLVLYRQHNLRRAEQGLDPERGIKALTASDGNGFHVDLGR